MVVQFGDAINELAGQQEIKIDIKYTKIQGLATANITGTFNQTWNSTSAFNRTSIWNSTQIWNNTSKWNSTS